ncbi:MAG TPA: alanine--tRNA ligase [Patescibacteria group bacterium]|nr:alanine--tRNA ligase [Patescibacteria group bacterium]
MKKRSIFVISLLLGLIVAFAIYQHIGFKHVFEKLKLFNGWQMIALFSFTAFRVFIWTLKWKLILKKFDCKDIPLLKLSASRVAEIAISYTTPGVYWGGEGIRIFSLKKHHNIPISRATTTVLLDRLFDIFGFSLFLFIGFVIAIFSNNLLVAALLLLGILIACAGLFIGLKVFGLKRILGWLTKILHLNRIKSLSSGKSVVIAQKLKLVGHQMVEFLKKGPKHWFSIVFVACFAFFIEVAQLFLFFVFLKKTIPAIMDLFVARAMMIFSSILSVIPGNIGIYEGASVLGFETVSLSAKLGLTFSLLTRFFDLIFVGFGAVILISYSGLFLIKVINGDKKDKNIMQSDQIRQKFINFFKRKDHTVVKTSSIVPADSSVLFTSAGMQQFIPYLSGDKQPQYKRAVSVQKCFRTSDIEEVGDKVHHTFFEMLGNWSFGDYFKEEAIKWSLDFLTNELNIKKEKIWVTIFKGNEDVPKDTEALKIWQQYIPKKRIKEFGSKDNFWGPVGEAGPCGPCSEIHIDMGEEFKKGKCDLENCGPNCSCGRFVEVWNLVFMQYNLTKDNKFKKLPQKSIDTGAGLERLTALLQGEPSDYETDLFKSIMVKIDLLLKVGQIENKKAQRIIADHARGICFLISDGVLPSNKGRGYVLRRLIRRAIRYLSLIGGKSEMLPVLAKHIIKKYKHVYPKLLEKNNDIITIIQKESEKFEKTLNQGLREFKKLVKETKKKNKKEIDPQKAFHLYDTYGFPYELSNEMAKENGLKVNEKDFNKAFKEHKKISRAGVKKKFGGVGELGETVAPHHSATHLLQQALRDVLGDHVKQTGSDLKPDRLRFDFIHDKPLTDKEIKEVEDIVNDKIKKDLKVTYKEMPLERVDETGALAFFKEKYPKIVKVYSIGDYSKEVCAGPHVNHTGEIGGFKIIKEKSSGAGVRRIKAKIGKNV